ncbi:Flp family type IVb pilin [Pasteurella canis]|uniref:Flp family type IVb pilin n=1 Tax=Pasteurella canis TaxID=753 RepID=UPI001E2D9B18|nr:Flp family type IVb pilin [Pasteurella canis]
MDYFFKFKECQKGITSIEYGLIAVIIAVFVVAVLYGNNGFIIALQTKFQLLTSTVVTAVLSK